MRASRSVPAGCAALFAFAVACAAERGADPAWWRANWRYRTTVSRPTPCRHGGGRPVETAVDLPLLLKRAGIRGEVDPGSIRVVARAAGGRRGREVPFALRREPDLAGGAERTYLSWFANPADAVHPPAAAPPTAGADVGAARRRDRTPASRSSIPPGGTYDVYFDTKERGIERARYAAALLPPANLVVNGGFEAGTSAWTVRPAAAVRVGRFGHTTGKRSLKVVFDAGTPTGTAREVRISQKIDVRKFAGREMVFECDLLAERAAYGAPVSIELQQFREDGSRIPEYAVQSRWLTIELAAGQLVRFRQRGRFNPRATALNVCLRLRCTVRDADAWQYVSGPEAFFTVWLDRVLVRPGERWAWPAPAHGGFVCGALAGAPLNRGFHFTGLRRLAFNGASEGTLQAGRYNPDPKSVHWALRAGTMEFWCRPSWNADDGAEHVFFEGVAYGHRLQSRLRKRGADGGNRLEFTIADAGGTRRTVRGRAPFGKGRWHHVAATWDFPRAQLQLFVDGRRVGRAGPGKSPWPSSTTPVAKGGPKGIGIMDKDSRSLPMQAFWGGDRRCRPAGSAECVLDEVRVSDTVRYVNDFEPPQKELAPDEHTRALFHFENEIHGAHAGDDRFVRGHLACELPPQRTDAPLDVLHKDGRVERRSVTVRPHPSAKLFEANRAENNLPVHRPLRKLPDPRFVELRRRRTERTVTGSDDAFELTVGGDYEPLMTAVTFRHAGGAEPRRTLLPRWRANDNVVPFSPRDLADTLAPRAGSDAEKAREVFRYALHATNYFDAHYCETLPARHRQRVSYTLIKALNIYPFDQCGPLNYTLRKLFLVAGISSNDASGTHHQFEQAYYDGDWRLFDLSPRLYWLNRDDRTVAARRAFEEDLYLKLRQGSGVCSALRGRVSRARFGGAQRPHRMDFPLRAGERVSVCWQNEGRWFERADSRRAIPLAKIPPLFGNGATVYEPTAGGPAATRENAIVETREGKPPLIRPRRAEKPATLIYELACPYILSDGRVVGEYEADRAGAVALAVSCDGGKHWADVWRSAEKRGRIDADLLDRVCARYAYRLKLSLAGGSHAQVTGLAVRTTFVVSPLTLPGALVRGRNRIRFVGGPVTAPVRTACCWVERHRSNLGVALNAISYYMNGDAAHRNVYVVAPGEAAGVEVSLLGASNGAAADLEGLPDGWQAQRAKKARGFRFSLRAPSSAEEGAVRAFELVIRRGGRDRRVPAQILVADAPLVREAERADRLRGGAAPLRLGELSGAAAAAFGAHGSLAFDFRARRAVTCALWLRARWKANSSTNMTLSLDEDRPRSLRAAAMIGFSDWTSPARAHTKMFAHFGEQYAHWSWYRVPEVRLSPGRHRLVLAAQQGAQLDALLLLPQNARMDRAAMNLFQNWNYAPWDNPF